MRRAETMQRRADHHERQDARRTRTRHLIELGGLVQKAGLVELTGDDRNAILGGLLAVAAMLQTGRRGAAMAVLAHRGRRAFRGDKESPSGDAPAPW
ncbi:conjugal transfer protein TraD [Brevundimonas diminuta]|uniref:conjugal transfer protein TraD n=1 Tax=Brevundimonas diminuta TaxID=293 RepID=UPI00320AD890